MKTVCALICFLSAIALFGCAVATPPSIYVPHRQNNVTYYYRNGIPIIVAKIESSMVCFVVDPSVELGSKKYIRVWALFQNNAECELLIEPLKFLRLTPHIGRDSLESEWPESPTKILTRISNEAAADLILQSIGGALKALSTQPTTATSSTGDRLRLNDRQEKMDRIAEQTGASVASAAVLYQAYAKSVSSGILRRNTIFPGESVNGYIYFAFPKINQYFPGYADLTEYELCLEVLTTSGTKVINLTRLEGE